MTERTPSYEKTVKPYLRVCLLPPTSYNKSLPHIEWNDLVAIVKVVFIDKDNIVQTGPVTFDVLDGLEKKFSEVWNDAWDNLEDCSSGVIRPLDKVISDLGGVLPGYEEVEDVKRAYILTSSDFNYGAAHVMQEPSIRKMYMTFEADGIVMLPSSIHEVILYPYWDDKNPVELKILNTYITEINTTVLEEKDILSNHAYIWRPETGWEW